MPRKTDPFADHLLTRSNEEIQAEVAKRTASDPFYGKVKVLTDSEDKKLEQYEFDPYVETDPLSAAVNSVKEPGWAYKLCSPRVASHYGGLGGYQKALSKEGKEVTLGNMFVGKIPQHVADARKKKRLDDAYESVRDQESTYAQQADELRAAARDLGMSITPIGTGEAATYGDASRERALGIEVTRGQEPA